MENIRCKKCGKEFSYRRKEGFWDEKGTESTKLIKCIYCNTPNVIGYWKLNKNGTIE